MRKFKKVLAFALAAAMVITAAPVTTQAATMKLNKTAATIYINGSKTYKTVDLGVQGASTKTYARTFTSSNTSIATVNKSTGVVTPKKNGKVTVTAKVVNKKTKKTVKTLKCTVTVKTAPKTVKVANKDLPKTLNIGQTYDFGSSITPKDATSKRRWSVTKGEGEINAGNGLFKATSAGEITVQVKDTYSGKTATHTFTVVADAPTATQTGAKTITIKNGVSMAGRTITVKKGENTVNLDSTKGVQISTDGLSAIVTAASKLTDGAYTVSIANTTDSTTKTAEVTATSEKVTKIAFLSDKAAIDAKDDKKAYVGYKVENQFGEDITKTTSVTINGSHSAVESGTGKIVFSKDSNFNQNVDIVSAVVINTESGVSAQGTFTVSSKAAVSSVVVKGIYNIDGKTLNADTDLNKDSFYLLVEAKDQYGANITKDQELGTDVHVNVAGGFTKLGCQDSKTKTTEITKDGVAYMAIELKSTETDTKKPQLAAGEGTVLVIAGGNGQQATATITVSDGTMPVTFTAAPTGTVVAGAKNEFTFEATDAYGKTVTDIDILKKYVTFTTPSVGGAMVFEKDSTGKTKLYFNASTVSSVSNDTPVIITAAFGNNGTKIQTIPFTVKKNAIPSTITGLKIDNGFVASSSPVNVKVEDLKVEDQYGNLMDKNDLATALSAGTVKLKALAGTENDAAVGLSASGSAIATSGAIVASGSALTNGGTVTSGSILFTVTPGATAKSVSRKLTLAFTNMVNNVETLVANSVYDATLTVAPTTELSGYVVKSVDKLYGGADANNKATNYSQTVEVTAKRGTAIVKLTNNDFTVIGGKYTQATNNTISSKALPDDFKVDGKDVDELKDTIKIVINQTGDEYTQDVVISKAKPMVTSAKFLNNSKSFVAVSGTAVSASAIFNDFDTEYEVKDQYGKTVKAAATPGSILFGNDTNLPVDPRITFKTSADGAVLSNNGSKDASLTLKSGNTATVVIDFGNGISLQAEITCN